MFDDDSSHAPNMKRKQIMITLQQATAMFNFELRHLQGKDVILADYLSRDGSVLNNIDPHCVNTVTSLQPQLFETTAHETV